MVTKRRLFIFPSFLITCLPVIYYIYIFILIKIFLSEKCSFYQHFKYCLYVKKKEALLEMLKPNQSQKIARELVFKNQ